DFFVFCKSKGGHRSVAVTGFKALAPPAPPPLGGEPAAALDPQLPPLRPRLRTPPRPPRSHRLPGHDHPHDPPPRPPRLRFRNRRSEERRVGKECRCRWSG